MIYIINWVVATVFSFGGPLLVRRVLFFGTLPLLEGRVWGLAPFRAPTHVVKKKLTKHQKMQQKKTYVLL